MGTGSTGPSGAASPGRAAALVGVRPDEVARLRALLAGSALLGACLVTYYTSANALFLTRYGVDVLPWVYIVNGVLVVAAGVAYARLGRRRGLRDLSLTVTLVLAASIVGLWAAVAVTDAGPVLFLLMTWFRLLFIYTTLGLWELAARLFDVRQAKRLFALVGLGLMAAFVLGGLLAPVLVALVGTRGLLGLSAAFLCAYAVSLRGLLAGVDDPPAERDRAYGVVAMVRDPYPRVLFALKTLSVLTAYLTEYAFLAQAAARFPDAASLAGFLGAFTGGTTLVMVLVTALLTGRLLVRRGVQGALSTMPLAMVVTALLAVGYGSTVSTGTAFFFALVALVMFANQVLEKGVYTPTLSLLFQPLPTERRLPVRLAVEGWLGSVALVASGLLLLALAALDPSAALPALIMLLAVSTVFLLVSRAAYRLYVDGLRAATRRVGRPADALALPAALDPDFVRAQLRGDDPARVLATVRLLSADEAEPAAPHLPALLGAGSPEVVASALELLSPRHVAELARVRRLADDPAQPVPVREAAVRALAAVDPPGSVRRLADDLDGPSAAAAAGALARHGGAAGRALVTARVERDRRSADPAARRGAVGLADALGEGAALVPELLGDPDRAVAGAALASAARHPAPELLAQLLLLDPAALPVLRAVAACGAAGGDALLARLAGGQPAEVDDACWTALRASCGRPVAPVPAVDLLRPALERQRQRAGAARAAGRAVATAPSELLVSLEEEAAAAGAAAVTLIALAGPDPGAALDAGSRLAAADAEERARAVELLEVLAPAWARPAVRAVLEEGGGTTAPAPVEDDLRFTAWTRGLARRSGAPTTTPAGAPVPDPAEVETVLRLKTVEIFARTPYAVLADLVPHVRPVSAPAGSPVVRQGEPGNELFLVVSGLLVASSGGRELTRMGPGEVFGELAVLDPAPRSADVTAERDSTLLALSRRSVLDLLAERPEVAADVMTVLVRRLRARTPSGPP